MIRSPRASFSPGRTTSAALHHICAPDPSPISLLFQSTHSELLQESCKVRKSSSPPAVPCMCFVGGVVDFVEYTPSVYKHALKGLNTEARRREHSKGCSAQPNISFHNQLANPLFLKHDSSGFCYHYLLHQDKCLFSRALEKAVQ